MKHERTLLGTKINPIDLDGQVELQIDLVPPPIAAIAVESPAVRWLPRVGIRKGSSGPAARISRNWRSQVAMSDCFAICTRSSFTL